MCFINQPQNDKHKLFFGLCSTFHKNWWKIMHTTLWHVPSATHSWKDCCRNELSLSFLMNIISCFIGKLCILYISCKLKKLFANKNFIKKEFFSIYFYVKIWTQSPKLWPYPTPKYHSFHNLNLHYFGLLSLK